MNQSDLIRLGVPPGEAMRRGLEVITRCVLSGSPPAEVTSRVEAVIREPHAYAEDVVLGGFAGALMRSSREIRAAAASWTQWGTGLEPEAVNQMARACRVPVAVAGALMPDAHVGYGLPIGGVLATDNAVIPYAVGVDIACRMKLSVVDLPVRELDRRRDRLVRAIESETRFGVGARFDLRRDHEVMEADWTVSPVTRDGHDRAWGQLGTSGSGNHFVEWGTLTVGEEASATDGAHDSGLSLPPGEYVALLSHSGSRGIGAAVCDHYSRRATERCGDLPKDQRHLAWLPLDSDEGREYWAAMELMGRYAAANHALIHRHLAEHLGLQVLAAVENHHNFAWRETHVVNGEPRELIVHRKGTTPAGDGVLGVIPGSMAAPGFVVRGRGHSASLHSASHGAGRVMSRKKAAESFEWSKVQRLLRDRRVHLISAGLDEAPGVYKDIHAVMAAQSDLVEVLAEFHPRIVKMAPAGERPED
ncbi:MAG: RtcB family protein [Verrucomicrobiae bacterium]|nr:RtcB family protein [Verrucomicrobiae bacterium]